MNLHNLSLNRLDKEESLFYHRPLEDSTSNKKNNEDDNLEKAESSKLCNCDKSSDGKILRNPYVRKKRATWIDLNEIELHPDGKIKNKMFILFLGKIITLRFFS